MAMMKVNDARIYYEVHGQGQPVIFISGYTSDHAAWLPIVDTLSQNFQVLIFDNRGTGQTIDKCGPLSAELMAQDVLEIITQLKLYRPHIVGSSMGGTIAQCLASMGQEKIGKLCLVNSSAKWRIAVLEAFKALLILREKNLDFDFIFQATLPWLFGEAFLSDQGTIDVFKQLKKEYPYPQSLENQSRQFQVLETFDGRKLLDKIQAETLIVYGIEDIISLPGEAIFLKDHIKKASLAKFDCGHIPHLEQTDLFVKRLVEFLSC